MDRIIAGATENVEAEYGFDCELPFILVHLYNDEPVSVEGFTNEARCRECIREEYSEVKSREFMF